MNDKNIAIKPADLRGILTYVPKFQGQTFVIALDGSVIKHDNLPNILLDIAVLRSLQIKVVIVHGIGSQLEQLATERSITISDSNGSGTTDAATLDLAIRASSRVSHQILEYITQSGLKCAITNAVRAKPIGILKGQDYKYSGKIDQIDSEVLTHLIDKSIVPIIQPIGFDRNGHTLRINSDLMAVEVAHALKATKILFLTNELGLSLDSKFTSQISIEDLEAALGTDNHGLSSNLTSKAKHAANGVNNGISRIHILDGTIHDGLIREVFSNEGVGTLIYGNEYQQIRRANRDDIPLIYHLTRSSVEKDELIARPIDSIESNIENYFVYEIDGNMIGCMLLSKYASNSSVREINSLFVHALYQKQGIGKKMVNFACHQAKLEGASRVIALSTQSLSFFTNVCDFNEVTSEDLPDERRMQWESSKRKSKIFIRDL
ncbi:amino-acid N-acetyltransferase [Puniceicoccaceae bacterium K14]|nr:amino-acid N-acetyltransferase [Puniceicoccaceae bacterium K14]